MCQFFSFVTKGSKKYYFDWEQRQKLLSDNPKEYKADSHTSICHFYNLDEDNVNKYEYNPFTKAFSVDQINIKDNRALAKLWVEKLDFKTIVEPLTMRPIINPFKDVVAPCVDESHLVLLRRWDSVRDSVWASVRASVGASVRASVWASVGASVWDSVGDSVGASVRASVRASVGASVGASVWASVGDSVGASVWDFVWASVWDSVRDSVGDSVSASVWDFVRDSVGASVGDSVWAYTAKQFNIKKWEHIEHEEYTNPFQCILDLWDQGFVPSFDGKTWRLHTKDGIMFEIDRDKL